MAVLCLQAGVCRMFVVEKPLLVQTMYLSSSGFDISAAFAWLVFVLLWFSPDTDGTDVGEGGWTVPMDGHRFDSCDIRSSFNDGWSLQ